MQNLEMPSYSQLVEISLEKSDYIQSQQEDITLLTEELHLIKDFIEWKGLTDELVNFKSHAHKEKLDEDLPFETYVL